MQGGNHPDRPATSPQRPRQGPGKPQSTEGPGRVRKPSARSRVAAGKRLLPSCDGRSIWARMFSDYYANLLAQLGGESMVSEARRMLCRRASLFEVELNIIESELARLRGQGSMKMLARKTALEWLAQYATMTNCAAESSGSNWLEQGGKRGAITEQLHCRDREQEGRGWGGMPSKQQ